MMLFSILTNRQIYGFVGWKTWILFIYKKSTTPDIQKVHP